jgi:hypothetical protein
MNLPLTIIHDNYIESRKIIVGNPDNKNESDTVSRISTWEDQNTNLRFAAGSSPFDKCLSCGTTFRGVEGKLAVTFEGDTHRRIGYVCPDCAQTKMAVIS